MGNWTERELVFALNEIIGIGWHTIRALGERVGFGGLADWLNRPASDWAELGMKPSMARKLAAGFRADRLEERLELANTAGIEWITRWDECYPPLLQEIPQPPWILYGKGDWTALSSDAIAIVGSRNPTVYGKKVALQLAEQLGCAGFLIVSGLARGIDACSHEGALIQGRTAAVMGTAFDRIYPYENANLARRIAASGIVLTEYPLGTPSHPGLFPRRNRIIAGLTLGTVVVEAAMGSGALITADFATESFREVFVVPGPVTSPKSAGPLFLMRNGARPIAHAEDIMEELKARLTTVTLPYNNGTVGLTESEPLTEEERRICELIRLEGSTFEELLLASGLPFAELHRILLSLQLKQRVREAQGAVYHSIWI